MWYTAAIKDAYWRSVTFGGNREKETGEPNSLLWPESGKTQGRGPETVGQFQKKIRKIETGARRIFYAVKNGGSLWVKGKICRGLNGSCGFMKWFVSMSLFSFLMSVKKRFLSWTVSWLVGADEAEGFWGAAKYWVWCFLRCGGTLFLSGRSSLFF